MQITELPATDPQPGLTLEDIILVRQPTDERVMRILKEALLEARQFVLGEIPYLTRPTDLARKHGVSKQCVHQLLDDYLPVKVRALWRNKKNLAPIKVKACITKAVHILRVVKRCIDACQSGWIRIVPTVSRLARHFQCSEDFIRKVLQNGLSETEKKIRHTFTWRWQNSVTRQIVDYAREVSKAYRTGTLERLPTYREIANKFGTTLYNVEQAINRYLTEDEREPWTAHKGKKR